ncbi:MAG: hypothetical protein IPH94_17215 [Saprospiraceae bacterium]|nr:hypothetical protein [Saprospiraceae bacterium]
MRYNRINVKRFQTFAVGLFLMVISEGQSQNFYGSMVLGVNASQIDGDNAAGFNKPGLTGGFKIDYPISASLDISAELLYSSRGAGTIAIILKSTSTTLKCL